MKRPVRILLTVVAVIAVIVCVFCILFIVQYVRGKSVSDKLGSGVRSGQVVEPLDPQDDGKYMAINVDFDSLHDVNPEIYAWIEVPGTNINYAVVQSAADDLFYDDHGVDRSYYSGGSIFSQRYNTTTFQDPVTVLYGHNRQSQTGNDSGYGSRQAKVEHNDFGLLIALSQQSQNNPLNGHAG